MGRAMFVLVLSGLLFGGAGIALGRASERATPAASVETEECAVVSLPATGTAADPSEASVAERPPVAAPPSVERREGATPSEPGAPRVRRLVVTSGVAGHEPLDELDEVRVGSGPLYAFVDAANGGGETTLEVTFEHDGSARSTGHIELDVPAHARRHRTWAFTRGIRTEGLWYAVVRDAHGEELARVPFDVVAAE